MLYLLLLLHLLYLLLNLYLLLDLLLNLLYLNRLDDLLYLNQLDLLDLLDDLLYLDLYLPNLDFFILPRPLLRGGAVLSYTCLAVGYRRLVLRHSP